MSRTDATKCGLGERRVDTALGQTLDNDADAEHGLCHLTTRQLANAFDAKVVEHPLLFVLFSTGGAPRASAYAEVCCVPRANVANQSMQARLISKGVSQNPEISEISGTGGPGVPERDPSRRAMLAEIMFAEG